MKRESFGMLDRLSSGRWRARYTGPDGRRHKADSTFSTKAAARQWLATAQSAIAAGRWEPPEVIAERRAGEEAQRAERRVRLAEYASTWLATRTSSQGQPLRPRTREEYERLLRGPLAPLSGLLLGEITPALVRSWRADALATGTTTQTSRAYSLLKSIMATAIEDRLITEQPCTIRGGSQASSGREVTPPTDAELETILATIRPELRPLVLIAAVGGLRWGEVIALRACDVTAERDEAAAVRIRVHRGVTRTKGSTAVGSTKSRAGVRDVAIFGDDAQVIAEHINSLIGEALLFPAADRKSYLSQSTFHRHWDRARKAAGRPDLPFHALRHYAGTSYAQTGATIRETMARLGHSSTVAAMRYQHSGSRDDELAARMTRRRAAAD